MLFFDTDFDFFIAIADRLFDRYDGLEYGLRLEGSYTEEMYARSRNDGFNETVRARIMAGNYFLLREYVRTLILILHCAGVLQAGM